MKQKWMAALLALCLLASLCACGGKTPADETPDRPDTEQTGSASPGETTGDTDCAHEQLTANVTQPTCTQAGSVVYTCDICGAAVRTTPLPAMNHSYRWEDDDSGHWQVCAICGDAHAAERRLHRMRPSDRPERRCPPHPCVQGAGDGGHLHGGGLHHPHLRLRQELHRQLYTGVGPPLHRRGDDGGHLHGGGGADVHLYRVRRQLHGGRPGGGTPVRGRHLHRMRRG